MNRKRILISMALILALLLCTSIIFISTNGLSTSARHAYQACRQVMLNTEGYGVWELQSSLFLLIYAHYTFSDGFNDATCSVTGSGASWQASPGLQTLAACMQSLDSGAECPRAKYGVTP